MEHDLSNMFLLYHKSFQLFGGSNALKRVALCVFARLLESDDKALQAVSPTALCSTGLKANSRENINYYISFKSTASIRMSLKFAFKQNVSLL